MAGETRIQVSGVTELTHAFDQWEGEVRAPRQMFTALERDVIQPDIEQRFSQEGPGWPALAPSTAAWKAKRYPGRTILVETGAMRAALTGFGGQTSRASANTLDLGAKGIPYFPFHQAGTRRIPARPMIRIDELSPKIHDYIERWLTKRAQDFGLKPR